MVDVVLKVRALDHSDDGDLLEGGRHDEAVGIRLPAEAYIEAVRATIDDAEEVMPLSRLILESQIKSEDADLLESLFNQLSEPGGSVGHRRVRTVQLVKMFVEGKRDRAVLTRHLMERKGMGSSGSCSLR